MTYQYISTTWYSQPKIKMLSFLLIVEVLKFRSQRPLLIKSKSCIDLSVHMSSYHNALRKTVDWYKKIAIYLIWEIPWVNFQFLCKEINESSIQIGKFGKVIIEALVFERKNIPVESETLVNQNKRKRTNTYTFVKKEGPSNKIRKFSRGCYGIKQEGLLVRKEWSEKSWNILQRLWRGAPLLRWKFRSSDKWTIFI